MSEAKTRIFLVDDHPLVREWLTNLIHQQPDFVVCGEAESSRAALEAIGRAKPNIVIVDISLKDGSGLDVLRDLKAQHPAVASIVLSMHDERLYAERALRAGARGYVMKRETTKNVISAIRQVLAGKLYVSGGLTTQFAEKFIAGQTLAASPLDQLSNRELEVFQFLGQGYGTREIAEALHVSIKTVQVFCARIKEKLKLANASELLREAIRWQESQRQG